MKSRLFCRQTDPTALFRGLHTVEACSTRLDGISRTIERWVGSDLRSADDTDGLGEVVAALAEAKSEIDACADLLESVIEAHGGEDRWTTATQEHYPELVSIGVPPRDGESVIDGEGAHSLDRPGLRRTVSSVKDRYTTTVVALPWLGPDRDAFCGHRLTSVRSAMERAELILSSTGPIEEHTSDDDTSEGQTSDDIVVDLRASEDATVGEDPVVVG